MKFELIKELEDEKFRRLTGVKRKTFEKMVFIHFSAADGLSWAIYPAISKTLT